MVGLGANPAENAIYPLLMHDADGSLDLYLKPSNPGAERVTNWLPMPTGPVGITMRL